MFQLFIKISNALIKSFPEYFSPLKETILKSDNPDIFEAYIARMIMYSFIAFLLVSLSSYLFLVMKLGSNPISSLLPSGAVGIISSFIVILLFHAVPMEAMTEKSAVINANLPFAANHMAAIASAGVSPYVMFKLVSEIKEYKELSKQLKKVVRNIDTFGMDITTAISQVAEHCPSEELSKFLHGIVSTIEGGGDLIEYLKMTSENAMILYKLKRRKYIALLETYADFYTALLVAAALFVVSLLAVLSMMSENGTVMGLEIDVVMRLAVYVLIPLMNITFLAFLELTQPEV